MADVRELFLRGVWQSAIRGEHSAWVERVTEPVERAWSLFEIDLETEASLEPMRGLYEDLLDSDPSGDEMRAPDTP